MQKQRKKSPKLCPLCSRAFIEHTAQQKKDCRWVLNLMNKQLAKLTEEQISAIDR